MDETIKIKIEAYLNGTMSLKEESAFEEQIKNSSSLKREVALARQINLHLSDNFIEESIPDNELTQQLRKELRTDEAKELKKKLQEVSDAYIADTSKKGSRSKVYLIAASIAILLISSISLFFINQNTSEKLFAEYYSESDLPAVIKRDNNQDYFSQAVTKFNEKAYPQAIELLETYIKTTEDINPSVYIYSGVAHWEIGENDKAFTEFDKMINSNAIDASKAMWFKALLYLKTKNKSAAKTTLTAITKDPLNYKYAEAKELLSKL